MKKIVLTIIATTILAFSLGGCESEADKQAKQAEEANNNIGKSTPLPKPLEIPEKGKYKY